jgi:uncharacterized membrane protein YhiD involved in acid resistance
MQGIVTGIGCLGGAGTILELGEQRAIKGLTTAAVGLAVGVGWNWPAVLSTALALTILFFVHHLE